METIKVIWEDYRKYCLIGFCVLIGLMVMLFSHGKSSDNSVSNQLDATSTSHKQLASKSSSDEHAAAYVDVKGAVKRPGVYKLRPGLRVQDAITFAGGLLEGADANHVNMAQAVTDQQIIYVPMQGEVTTPIGEASVSCGAGSENTSSAASVVNLNTATKEDLMQITGVGDKKADLILLYRQQHGQFKAIDDLKNVSGFGDKSVDKIRDQLSI